MSDNPFEVRRPGAFVQFSDEVLADAPRFEHVGNFENNTIALRVEVPRPLTDAERAEHAARAAERDARRAAFTAALTAAGGLVAALADLHTCNEYGDCAAESDTGSVEWYTSWPCETLRLAAEHAGIDVPEGL